MTKSLHSKEEENKHGKWKEEKLSGLRECRMIGRHKRGLFM